jgi:hypothetical protein
MRRERFRVTLRDNPFLSQFVVVLWEQKADAAADDPAVARLCGQLNNPAYAILGIPSIIFGMALSRRGRSSRLPGILLALNGGACIIGMAGVVLGSVRLEIFLCSAI